MGTRELVKLGKLSVKDALANFATLRKSGTYVGEDIIRWLERRKGIVVVEQPQQQPRKNKQKRKNASAE